MRLPCCCTDPVTNHDRDSARPLPLEQLAAATPETVHPFSFNELVTHGKLLKNYDGDTGDLAIIAEDGKLLCLRVRMMGYDSPEIRPPVDTPNRVVIQEQALCAKDRLKELCSSSSNGVLRVVCGNFDKYGRVLVTLFPLDVMNCSKFEDSINARMIREGHGVAYNGGHHIGAA